MAIFGIVAAGHANLIAVINLRDTTQRCQQAEGSLQVSGRAFCLGEEAGHVMVADECHQVFRMGEEPVLPQDIDQHFRGLAFVHHLVNRILHRKIKRGCEQRIDTVEAFMAARPVGSNGRIHIVDFPDREEAGIDIEKVLQVISPECSRNVREGIDTETVDAATLGPP